jgi:transcription antitermination factor NusB
MTVMRSRTRARALALQCLYRLDLREELVRGVVPDDALLGVEDEEADPVAVPDYARVLVAGVVARHAELDAAISATAVNWSLERMAIVDRNLLRIGAYELLFQPDIPAKVAIDEAVELGKVFSTERTGAFINGVLDAVRARAEA